MLPLHMGIVIPAHNEAEHLAACLEAVGTAIDVANTAILSCRHPVLRELKVSVLVVLDSCTDDSLAIVQAKQVGWIEGNWRCVGQVRDVGVRHLIAQGATWLACTDADSQVTPDWIVQQLVHIIPDFGDTIDSNTIAHPPSFFDASNTPLTKVETTQPTLSVAMICGVVVVDNWAGLSKQVREQYLAHYQDQMNHRHIHGANLSFCADAYLAVGGFDAMPCHEDVALVNKFSEQNLPIIWSNRVRVVTSSRLDARTSEGFAHFLRTLQQKNSVL